MRRRNFSPATIGRRIRVAQRFEAWLQRPILTASTDDIERWLDHIGRTPQTRYHYRSDLRMFWRFALGARLTRDDPTEDVERPLLPRMNPDPIPHDALAAALDLADPKQRLVIVLSALAGLRAMEIAQLSASDMRDGNIMVRQGKGKKDRTVPIGYDLAAELNRYGVPRRGPVIAKPNGDHYKPGSISAMISRFYRTNGIPARLHSGRHYFGTELIEAGEDVRVVAELLGHASLSTTMGYTKVSTGRLRGAANKVHLPRSAQHRLWDAS